jgi:mRNA interferase RelE/StbE
LKTYKLSFLKSAKKEWDKLDSMLQEQFKKKLGNLLSNPHAPKNKLAGMENCYKIKLRASGYRLVYRVVDERIIIEVIAVGKRDKAAIYDYARSRLG